MAESQSSAAIRKQLDQLARDLNNQINIQNTFQNTGGQAIDQTYRELGGKLQTNLGEIKGNVNTGRKNIGSAYDTSSRNINDAQSTVTALLGGQGALQGKFSSPLAEIQRLSAENSASRANSMGSYEQLGIGHINAGQAAIGDAAREGSGRVADLQSQIAAEIGELQRNYLGERSAMEVALAQVLDEERARLEQMQLEREKMAMQERIAAKDRAARSSGSGSGKLGSGRSAVLKWAVENGIGKKELDAIMQSIHVGNTTGMDDAAYRYANEKSRGKPGKASGKSFISKGISSRVRAIPNYNLDTVNTGLDIYYGRFE